MIDFFIEIGTFIFGVCFGFKIGFAGKEDETKDDE